MVLVGFFATVGFAQKTDEQNSAVKAAETSVAKTENSALMDLANATLKAHGGDLLKNMKSLTMIGSADITVSAFPQKVPGSFVTIFSGEKYRFELNIPGQPVKQIFDGEQTFSTIQGGFQLPPVNRFGIPLIQRIGDKDFVISGLNDDKEFKKGFRITTPEGFYTDFIIDKKTGLVKSYNSSFVVNGNNVSTSVEIDKTRSVDGIVVPEKYAQRFDFGQLTVYSEFKSKEIIVNKEIADDVFVMSK